MKSIIRSLRHRNFRLYFFGQGLSVTGTWMQSVAMLWLVYDLTGSKALLGLAGFASQILTFAVAPFAGVLADRWNRRRTIIAAQALAMAQAFGLAAVAYTMPERVDHWVEIWPILALSVLTGLVRGFEVPTRHSFIVQMLEDPADLPNAIALNAFLVNTARVLGCTLAGPLIQAIGRHGEATVLLINGASYATIIAALALMRIRPRRREAPAGDVLAGLKQGWTYVWHTPTLRAVLLLLALTSLVAVPYAEMLPAFAKDVHLLSGGPDTLSYLKGAAAVGALLALVLLAYRRTAVPLGRILLGGGVLFGLGLIAFGAASWYWRSLPVSLAVLAWVGLAVTTQIYACNTLLQTTADEDKRGRVMSFYTMAFMGMIPFGAILMGGLAEMLDAHLAPAQEGIGAPLVVAAGGFLLIVGTLILGRRLPKEVRPVAPAIEAG